MITGVQLAEKAEAAYKDGWGYIPGTAGEMWTEKKQQSLVAKYASDPVRYADHEHGAKIGSRWIGRRVADGGGFVKQAAVQLGLKGIHRRSETMFDKDCKATGKIVKGQKIPIGALIFTGNHDRVGVLVSETCVCEAKDVSSGVTHTPLSNKKWVCWGLMKDVDYELVLGSRKTVLSSTFGCGARGDDVRLMQELLAKDGSRIKPDGVFGIGTLSAVKSFQKRHGLAADGVVGPKTRAELLKLM